MDAVDELIGAHLDGGLDDEGQRRLEAWLAADPEHRRRFLRAAADHRALGQLLTTARAARPRPTRQRRARAANPFARVALLAAALALLLAGAWWASTPNRPTPRPVETAATPTAAADPPRLVTASGAIGAELVAGTRLQTDEASTLEVRWADGTTLRVERGSELTLPASLDGKRVALARGGLAAEVTPQPSGHPLRVRTAEAEVTVVGTSLAVARADGETAAEVTHGRVSVARLSDGATVAVSAGECATIAAGSPLVARALGAPSGRAYAVGEGQAYATLDALPALGPGDLVEIHPGRYRAARAWRESGTALRPIVLRGVADDSGEPPTIDGEGVEVSGIGAVPRALFQIEGSHYVVDGLAFADARNGENGAGIRCLGARDVVIRRCRVARCDDGIMAGDDVDDLRIEDCDIGWCGSEPHAGYCHGIYTGGGRAVVRGCRIHDTQRGQAIKSSSLRLALIANRITGAGDGELSLIDAPGSERPETSAALIGNLFVSKPDRQGNHRRFIEVGAEDGGLRGGTLTLTHNTFVAADARTIFIDTERAATRVAADANLFVGSDRIAALGAGGLAGRGNWLPASAEVRAGLVASILGEDPGFVDPATGDYRTRVPLLAAGGADAPAPLLAPGSGVGTVERRNPLAIGCFDPPR